MEVKTINDLVRENITEVLEDANSSDIHPFYAGKEYINGLDNDDFNLYNHILLMDLYKELFSKHKDRTLGSEEEEYLQALMSDDISELIVQMSSDDYMLRRALSATYDFDYLTTIEKINFFDMMDDCDELERMADLSPFVDIDLMFYSVRYDKKSFFKYYEEYMNKYSDNGKYDEICGAHKKIMPVMFGMIQEMKFHDKKNYIENVIAALPKYYAWKKYDVVNNNAQLIGKHDVEYVKMIESLSLDAILNMAQKDLAFTFSLINDYLSNEVLIPEQEKVKVKQFVRDNISTDLKNKIGL